MRPLVLLLALACSGCTVNTSGRVDVDPHGFQYTRDDRTGLCFAVAASRRAATVETTGLGLAHVPCEAIPQDLLPVPPALPVR